MCLFCKPGAMLQGKKRGAEDWVWTPHLALIASPYWLAEPIQLGKSSKLGVRKPGGSIPVQLISSCVMSHRDFTSLNCRPQPARIAMPSYLPWWLVIRIRTMMWKSFSNYSPLCKLGVILNYSQFIKLFLISWDVHFRGKHRIRYISRSRVLAYV